MEFTTPLVPTHDQQTQWLVHARPLPFEQAAKLVLDAHARDGARSDLPTTKLKAWAFGSRDGKTMQLAPVPLAGRDTRDPIALRELGFRQLANRITVPADYIRTLPPKLQIACMNLGLAKCDDGALLRLAGNEVRSVMSERYAPMDDVLFLEAAHRTLEESGVLRTAVVRATNVGTHTVLRLTVPSDAVPVRRDDVIEYGIDFANSELGLRSVQVTPITYRLICTNGMRAWRSDATMRMRHVGSATRLREQLREAVPIALAEARGDLYKWAKAVDVLIDSALDEINELRGFGVSNGDVREIGQQLAALPSTASPTRATEVLQHMRTTAFDVANAITSVARSQTSVEARLELEEIGHRYLTRATR